MNRRFVLVMVMLLCASILAAGQAPTPIRGFKNIRLAPEVHEAVAIGGVKDLLACDAAGNIYTVANRGYSSTYASVVRIQSDGRQLTRYNLDHVPELKRGHTEAFEISGDRVHILARQVTRQSDTGTPLEFGADYLLSFTPAGELQNRLRLQADFGSATPAGLVVMRNGGVFVAGYALTDDRDRIRLVAWIFSANGVLETTIPLTPEGTQATNADAIGSMSVLRPAVLNVGGLIYVLRGSTRDPVFVFSQEGKLQRTLKLQAEAIEFSSPKLHDNRLIVHQHAPIRKSHRLMITEPEPDEYLIFDVSTGALIAQYAWKGHGQLACFDGTGIVVVQQDLDYGKGSYWAIVHVEPIAEQPPQPDAPSAAISLDFRWVVPCAEGLQSLKLRGDLAAREYCLSSEVIVDERDIESADIENYDGRVGMLLLFTPGGSTKLRKATTGRKNEQMAVVINGELVFMAIVMEALSHSAVITGPGLDEVELRHWIEQLNNQAERRSRVTQT